MFILALATAVPLIASSDARPAQAEILYPYCTMETPWEGARCDFRTFEQCVAFVAGQRYTCVPNKWYIAARPGVKRRAG
jgi:hypothetical protein